METLHKTPMEQITCQINSKPGVREVIDLFIKSELPRPNDDPERIRKMLDNSDLIVTATYQNKLVGICRCITDWAWCCYLSDLAVDPAFKQSGIGRQLIQITRETLGEQVMILLLSVPTAMTYYPRVGFAKENRAFIINRTN